MSRHQQDPLRPLTADERQELTRLSRSLSAPAAQVERSRALLAIADGASYTAAAHQVGRRHTELRLGQPLQPRRARRRAARPWVEHGSAMALRQHAFWRNGPEPPSASRTARPTWSLSLLQKALRQAVTGCPGQHVHDLAHVARGRPELAEEPHLVRNRRVAMRQRKHGVVRVSDPDAMAK